MCARVRVSVSLMVDGPGCVGVGVRARVCDPADASDAAAPRILEGGGSSEVTVAPADDHAMVPTLMSLSWPTAHKSEPPRRLAWKSGAAPTAAHGRGQRHHGG